MHNFNHKIEDFITNLKINNNIHFIDLCYLYTYTMVNYSPQRYLNNKRNINILLSLLSKKLLQEKHCLSKNISIKILNNFKSIFINDILDSYLNKENFYIIRETILNKLDDKTSSLLFEFIKQKLGKTEILERQTISFILKLIDLINQSNDDNWNSLGDIKKTGDNQFSVIHFDHYSIPTINFLANNVLNTDFSKYEIQIKITKKLASTPMNKLINPSLTTKINHNFIFWELFDNISKQGIGYWYPYFTTTNTIVKEINVNYQIPCSIIRSLKKNDIILPKVDGFDEQLKNCNLGDIKQREISSICYGTTHNEIRDYLALNSDIIEDNLSLISKEYKTNKVGVIDILFEDKQGGYLIIEVEKEVGKYQPVGQILNYAGYVRSELAEGKRVRGIIVCKDIHEQLRSALKEAINSEIEVWIYEREGERFMFKPVLRKEGLICPYCGNFCSPRASNCPKCGDPLN